MEQAIEKILNEFDFERVHAYMVLTNWTWAGKGVPSVDELRKTARSLLRQVGDGHTWFAATGGFRAEYDERRGWLSLGFAIEERERLP